MDEIEMKPVPDGTWIMICPCGQTEVRGRGVKPCIVDHSRESRSTATWLLSSVWVYRQTNDLSRLLRHL